MHVPASIVDDLLYDTPNVAIAFRKVERAEGSWRLVVMGVRLELDIRKSTELERVISQTKY